LFEPYSHPSSLSLWNSFPHWNILWNSTPVLNSQYRQSETTTTTKEW
jgi:hypothetical protein